MTAFTPVEVQHAGGRRPRRVAVAPCREDGLVEIIDHAVVSWPQGAKRPDIKHHREDTWRGTGWGAFWGLLFGALFFVPVLAGAAGAGIGAISAATNKMGLTGDQLEPIRGGVTGGTSALFVVTDHGDLDRVGEGFRGVDMKLPGPVTFGWQGRVVPSAG